MGIPAPDIIPFWKKSGVFTVAKNAKYLYHCDMKNIINVNPNEIIAQADANFFMIIFTPNRGAEMVWKGNNTFGGFGGDFLDVTLFGREDAAGQYFNALRFARSEDTPSLYDSGRLDLVAIPKWG